MALAAGTRIGVYEVAGSLGEGGMGEVYRARDTKLNRDVALKILPELFASDPDRLARFQREAQLLASLNHPHIAQIYGLEGREGRDGQELHAIVLELVEGSTLADRIAQGPVPIDEALAIAAQIASALEAAHDRGVVHRDLKPANIKLTPDGTVKVLDFGLAKMLDDGSASASGPSRGALSMSPTLSVHATYAGVILGTAAYMSPEQARGRPVDKRADVWAFGCVLFEMLAAARPFDGDDVAEMIGAVIHKEPAWDRLPAATPPNVRLALERCLQKDPKQRMRDVGDVQLLLSGAFESPAATSGPPVTHPTRRRSQLVTVAAIAGAAVLAAAATWTLMHSAPATLQPMRFGIVTPPTQAFNVQGFFRNLAISDDGTHIVYVGGSESQLFVRAIDQLDAVPLRGVTAAGFPFLSPDGRWVGFFTGGAGGEIKKISITGGPAVTLCRYQGTARGASWGRDDTIIFATNDPATGLLSVPAGGGEPKVLTKPDATHGEQDHLFPAPLPDGRHLLFTISAASGTDAGQIAVLDLRTNQWKTLIRGGSDGQYVDTGLLVYATASSLRAVRFDPVRLDVLGDPMPVVEQVMTLQSGAADFRVSRQGTLVYVAGGSPDSPGLTRSLVWVTRDGREEPVPAPPRAYGLVRLSPDETQAALDVRDQQNDIWVWNFQRKTLARLTFDLSFDLSPVWTPDGKRIAFASARTSQTNLFWQASDGTGTAERLTESPNLQIPSSITPDGRSLVLSENSGKTGFDLMLFHFDTRRTEPLIQTSFAESGGEISPDGRWIAYFSNESGQIQVYVRPFPNVNDGRWLVSAGAGITPVWSRNGRELYYMSTPGAMMAVPVQTTPTFSAGNAVKLFDGTWFVLPSGRSYDVTADGKRFLMVKPTSGGNQNAAPPSITVVLNWTEELKARLPAK